MKSEKLGVITPILLPGPPGGYNAVLPTTVQHPMNMLGLGAGKSCPAREAVPHLQPSSSRWQHKGVCVSPAAVLAASHHFGRAGSHSSAKGRREEPAQGREGDGVLGWQEGMCMEQLSDQGSIPQEIWAMLRVHLLSLCQRQARGPRCVPGALLGQWSGCSGLCWSRAKPNSTQLFDHHRKPDYGEEFSLLICMIFFGERWSFGLSAFSLICLKSPILGHPNSFSQEKLDSAPGLLRNGCSRAK